MPEARIPIFVVEDDPQLRQYLVMLLDGEPTTRVIGNAGSAEEALVLLEELQPRLMLVDLALPGASGLELIAKVRDRPEAPLMMAHTVFDDRDNVLAAIRAGASGYVLKGCAPRELIEALQSLNAGGSPMSPRIARAVLRELQERPAPLPDPLSPRERLVLKLVDEGLTYKQIAERMSVSPHTVHSHIKNIYDQLHVRSREEALAKARHRGII
ncbi:MAG: response regulator transcription factor [Myxococcaceae bacterium]|nr:response regulator transcription factor [Myxococcaceae bacterium]